MRIKGYIFLLALVVYSLPLHAQKEIEGFWQNKNREAEINKNVKQIVVRNVLIDSPSISISYTTLKSATNFQHKDTTLKYKPQIPVMKTVNTKTYFAKYGINLKAAGLTKPTTTIYVNNCKCPGLEQLVLVNENTMLVFFGKTYSILTRSKTLYD